MSKIQGTLAQWRDRLRRKELSPAELVNLTADAIEADRTTNAYISFDREAALHAAAGADISSPLAGIPIAVSWASRRAAPPAFFPLMSLLMTPPPSAC